MHSHQIVLLFHFMGFTLWLGGMVALVTLVSANTPSTEPGPTIAMPVQRLGRLMDLGAGLAIAAGIVLLVTVEPSPMKAGWMHVKLLGVFALLGVHGFTRARLARAARAGKPAALPSAFGYAPIALFAVVLALVVLRPF